MDEHELMSALKAMALELGRTPTRAEFINTLRGGGYQLQKSSFGNYVTLVTACGLETYNDRRCKKITNAVFNKDIVKHLEEFKPTVLPERKPWPRIMSISDVHWPFCYQPVIDRFYKRIEVFAPAWVILNGDAWDMYSHSKFAKSHNIFTPREEERLAREGNELFWREVKKRAPNAKCVQMIGNHDLRPLRRVLETYPAAEDWVNREFQRLFSFDGVQTIFDHREELIIDDIAIFHGYRSGLGEHRDFTLMNTMNGHTHIGGTVFRQIRGRTLWELNSGLAGDPESKGLTYTPQKISKWTWGHSEVDEFGPRFLPL